MARSRHEKSKFRIYLEYYPFLLLYQVLHLMPLKWGYAFSDVLFRLLFFVDRKHRVRSIQHLMHAGIAKDHKEAVRMAAVSIRLSFPRRMRLSIYRRAKRSSSTTPFSVSSSRTRRTTSAGNCLRFSF